MCEYICMYINEKESLNSWKYSLILSVMKPRALYVYRHWCRFIVDWRSENQSWRIHRHYTLTLPFIVTNRSYAKWTIESKKNEGHTLILTFYQIYFHLMIERLFSLNCEIYLTALYHFIIGYHSIYWVFIMKIVFKIYIVSYLNLISWI